MEEETKMIKDLAKNLANFCGKPPLIDPSKADCDDSILWESYGNGMGILWGG